MLRILFLSFNSIFSLGVPIAAVGGPRSSVDSIESHVNRRFLDLAPKLPPDPNFFLTLA